MVLWEFGPAAFREVVVGDVTELERLLDTEQVVWLDVTGLADTSAIAAIGRTFGLHALSLEDVLVVSQRPKVEHHDEYTFVVLEMLATHERVQATQLCVFFGERVVVTLHDGDASPLDPVRERLEKSRGNLRSRGADYLAYAIVDSVIDHYFPVLEAFDDHLEGVEDAMLGGGGEDPTQLARCARQDLQVIRHAVWPARDVVTGLLREETQRITDDTRVHLRDCYDHVVELQEMVEASREIAASLLEAYISKVSLDTNEVMKVLTVIATIFIPLTFITGLYGMNFNWHASPLNMPELNWYFGYPFALLLMAAAAAGSLYYFRRGGWFGTRRRR